ncbi:MAG: hypothetical protein Q9172_007823 [Xanthocarpia lactea]
MSSKAASTRRSASPVSSRTRASPSNGLSRSQQQDSGRRSASVPIALPPRTPKTTSTPPATRDLRSAIKHTPHASAADLDVSTPETQLNPLTIVRLRQAIRAQYHWEIPLDSECQPHIPDLPDRNRKAVTVDGDRLYNFTLRSRYLRRVLALKLTFSTDSQNYSLRPDGKPFPFRGQGPIWDQNSCHLDVCIVASRILNVGSTVADRSGLSRDSWLQTLQPVQRKFLDLISADWESLDRQTNIGHRHHFWDHELASLEGISRRPDFGSAINVWNKCTAQMRQFGFERSEGLSSCKHCGAAPVSRTVRHYQMLSLDMSQDQLEKHTFQFGQGAKPIGWWIDRELKPFDKRCGACKSPNGRSREREIAGALPQRLVVAPGQHIQGLISGATSDSVQFSYWSANGEQKATYRWLGGVYYKAHHFRLYWTDGEKGSPYPHIRVYDGRGAFGAIVGGIPASNSEDKVPRAWSRAPTILFYERINEAALEKAAESIKSQIKSGIAHALRLEAAGAQVSSIADPAVDGPQDSPEEEAEAETGIKSKGKETGQHAASNRLINEGEATGPGPGANSYRIPNVPRLQEDSGIVDNVQPTQPEEAHLEKQEDAANGPRAAGEEEGDSDSESALSSAPGSDLDEQERDGSDNDSDTPGENQDQQKDDDNDDEEGADGDDAPEDPAGDKRKQRSQSPPTSPVKSPPKSPVNAPKTPPLQIQRNGLLSGFSPSRLFGLFTPFRSGTKTPEPLSSAAQQAPVPDPHPAENQTNEIADTADDSSSLHSPSEDDEMSLQDQEESEDETPLLLTPPITPAKKRRSRTITSSGPVRRSQRIFKPRTSARMAQMIPPNTRTAGSMGPYKALPASRMYVAHDNTGERGRNVVRMSSVTIGQKRSSSASSVSSTGSTAGGGNGRSSNGVKRVRYAVIRG